jgi:hypothetical protein
LKSKFDSCASFHVSVSEDDFPLINETGVWLATALHALSADQIYSIRSSVAPMVQAVVLFAALLVQVVL